MSITTSAFASASERAAAADCGWSSGSKPLAMDMGRKGMPVVSMKARMSASACAYAAPLPRMMSGRSALASVSSARQTDSDVLGLIHPIGCLCVRLGRVHLIELLIVALLQVDDGAVARSADLDHREPVDPDQRSEEHTSEL